MLNGSLLHDKWLGAVLSSAVAFIVVIVGLFLACTALCVLMIIFGSFKLGGCMVVIFGGKSVFLLDAAGGMGLPHLLPDPLNEVGRWRIGAGSRGDMPSVIIIIKMLDLLRLVFGVGFEIFIKSIFNHRCCAVGLGASAITFACAFF